MRPLPLLALLACLLLLVAAPGFAGEDEGWSSWPGVARGGGTLTATGAVPEDLYLAGSTITSEAEVAGDIVAAGGVVKVGGGATEGVLAAGGVVDLTGKVGDDIRAAGGVVNLEGSVAHDAALAGGAVNLLPGSTVGGRGFLAGGVVRVDGSVGGRLRVAAGKAVINGLVRGEVTLLADEVEFGKGAVVEGRVLCLSRVPPRIDPGATLKGELVKRELPPREKPHRRWSPWGALALAIGWLLSLAVAGMVYLHLFPAFVTEGAARVRARFWACLGLGVAGLATVPFAALLLLFTLVGSLLGLVLAALYPVLLLAGSLTGSWFLADLLAAWMGRGRHPSAGARLASFFLALLLLGLVQMIPFLGGWVIALFLFVGTGSVLMGTYLRWKGNLGVSLADGG